jgi:peptidoglycan/LPS O-acetylase OafA/YrhL
MNKAQGMDTRSITGQHKNSFDFVRFLAAAMVVFAHSFALTGHAAPFIGNINLGGFGVLIFFILSGYLISISWDQYPRFNVFFAKRALRIFPGLFTALVLTILVVGLFYSSLSVYEFFTSQGAYTYLNNILLVNFIYILPGSFVHNIYPNAVNGSIWTLGYEFLMYFVLAILGVFGFLKKNFVIRMWIFLLCSQLLMSLTSWKVFRFNLFYFQWDLTVTMGLMFFTGVLAHRLSGKIHLSYKFGVLSLGLFFILATLIPAMTYIFTATFLAYGLFSLGRSNKLSWFSKYGDFSYGIYIYSFPLQQMIAASTGVKSSLKMFALSMTASVIAGALSWWLLESRALRLKSKINLKKYPLTQTDVAW